jgi:hypothetical protein
MGKIRDCAPVTRRGSRNGRALFRLRHLEFGQDL